MSLPPVIHVKHGLIPLPDTGHDASYGEGLIVSESKSAKSTPYVPAAALEAAQARIAALEEALRFYADPGLDGYDARAADYGLTVETGHIIKDGGAIARAALAESGG